MTGTVLGSAPRTDFLTCTVGGIAQHRRQWSHPESQQGPAEKQWRWLWAPSGSMTVLWAGTSDSVGRWTNTKGCPSSGPHSERSGTCLDADFMRRLALRSSRTELDRRARNSTLWAAISLHWFGWGWQDPISLLLPLPGPVWSEAEPASSCSSPRRPISSSRRGCTSSSVSSPTPGRWAGVLGPTAQGLCRAPTWARNKARCVTPAVTMPPAQPCPPPPQPICCSVQVSHFPFVPTGSGSILGCRTPLLCGCPCGPSGAELLQCRRGNGFR